MAHQRRPPFTKRLLLVAALAVLASVLPFSFASAQAPAPTGVSLGGAVFKGVTTPGPKFDVVQSLIDFSPGAKSPVITATTAQYLVAIEGDLTVDIDGKAETVAAGKGTAAPAGAKVTIANASTTKTRLFVSTLLGVGAVADVHQLSSAGVTVFTTSRITMSGAPAIVDISLGGARYDVGYRTANHVMNQPHLLTLTEGLTGFSYFDGLKETYGPGAQAEMYVGRPGYMYNAGTVKSAFFQTWVATPGVPLSIAPPAAPTAVAPLPPNTGTGLAQSMEASSGGFLPLTLAGAGAFALGGLGLGAVAKSRRAGKGRAG
jgi:quercetin dioxygenase-like cupin family protein